MKLKSLVVSFSTLVITTGLLYLVGHTFSVPWLMFYHEFTNKETGFITSTGSFTPLIIGLIVSFFAEKIYISKLKQKMS